MESIACWWPSRKPSRAFGSRYGAALMFSIPPATATEPMPPARKWAAPITVCMPEPHTLFTVVLRTA